MKKLEKQSMKELIEYALQMPVGDLQAYGTMFLSGPVPAKMTRGELIALQLVERAAQGELDSVRELRFWVAEDQKAVAPVGGTTYYQFLVNVAGNKGLPSELPPEAASGLRDLSSKIEKSLDQIAKNTTPSKLLDDLS